MDGPGIESRDFPHLSRLAVSPTHPPIQWVSDFCRCKKRPGREADLSPSCRTVVKKEDSYTSTPLWTVRRLQSLSSYKRVHFIFLHGITQRRKKELQLVDTYCCWGMTWSIFVDELRSATLLTICTMLLCLRYCQVKLKQLSYEFCEHVYRPACSDQDVSRSF